MTVIPPDNDQHLPIRKSEVAFFHWQWEEIVWAKKCVHNSAWEFDGYIKSAILNGRQWNSTGHSRSEVPPVTQACPVVTPCVSSRTVALSYTGVTQLMDERTSPECSYFTQASIEKIKIYFYIYYLLLFVWPEWNITWGVPFSFKNLLTYRQEFSVFWNMNIF